MDEEWGLAKTNSSPPKIDECEEDDCLKHKATIFSEIEMIGVGEELKAPDWKLLHLSEENEECRFCCFSFIFVTSCLMPTLLPLVTAKCTTMCSVHDLTYKIHRATVPLFDKLSRKEFSLKLQFSLIRNIWE